jgi:hypothetical protein
LFFLYKYFYFGSILNKKEIVKVQRQTSLIPKKNKNTVHPKFQGGLTWQLNGSGFGNFHLDWIELVAHAEVFNI